MNAFYVGCSYWVFRLVVSEADGKAKRTKPQRRSRDVARTREENSLERFFGGTGDTLYSGRGLQTRGTDKACIVKWAQFFLSTHSVLITRTLRTWPAAHSTPESNSRSKPFFPGDRTDTDRRTRNRGGEPGIANKRSNAPLLHDLFALPRQRKGLDLGKPFQGLLSIYMFRTQKRNTRLFPSGSWG